MDFFMVLSVFFTVFTSTMHEGEGFQHRNYLQFSPIDSPETLE